MLRYQVVEVFEHRYWILRTGVVSTKVSQIGTAAQFCRGDGAGRAKCSDVALRKDIMPELFVELPNQLHMHTLHEDALVKVYLLSRER